MNPIDAITSLTGQVLIRIGQAIAQQQPAPVEPITVHVHCHHDPIPRAGWRKR
ncbi:hypothetical protein G4X40_18615 [Rhodococcus sp. D2-41]|uniref:hypothetical protein n=1 Tax=Speluncibacter jeojiensis TaxID=2710754 RepID=UPI00240EFFE9|nr:hypothetical protein [Rhodococcus sp. D2-41]MDG3012159.1 hypothetical protein [Rhodococcus sp. D2-41]